MKMVGLLTILMSLSGCWCCSCDDFGYSELSEYTGSRSPEDLKKLIVKRYHLKGLLATGDADIYDAEKDKENSFDIEVAFDRDIKGLGLAGEKGIGVGSIFSFGSIGDVHYLTDYFADPPETQPLYLSSGFSMMGGVTVGDLRHAVFEAWPPGGQAVFKISAEEIQWGPWFFDPRSLALMEGRFKKWHWRFGNWEVIDGHWLAERWKLEQNGSWLNINFDLDEAEIDWEGSPEDFLPPTP